MTTAERKMVTVRVEIRFATRGEARAFFGMARQRDFHWQRRRCVETVVTAEFDGAQNLISTDNGVATERVARLYAFNLCIAATRSGARSARIID